MYQEGITIADFKDDQNVSVGYHDDDIVIIDNVKGLVESRSARVTMNVLVVAISGKAIGNVKGETIELNANQVFVSSPNATFNDFMMSPDFEFKAMFFTNRILQSFLREKMGVWNEMIYVHRIRVFTMGELDVVFFSHFYDMLRMCIYSDQNNPYKTDVIQSRLRSAFLALCGRMSQILPENNQLQLKQPDNIFQRFIDLLNHSKTKHRTVESYADELCISSKYLSAICKKNSGKTANQWITEHVLEDIRYYLQSSDLSIKQISSLVGFPNTSFFGRYVKEHLGKTPLQIRNNRR